MFRCKMNASKLAYLLAKNQTILARKFQRLSTVLVPYKFYQQTSADVEHEKEIVTAQRLELRRPEVKKWKRQPFVKNFFLGKFDTALLESPEVLDNEQVIELENSVQKINKCFAEKVDSVQIEKERKIPDYVLQNLKDMGLLGRLVPQQYGGLGLTLTEYARLNEVLSLDWSIGTAISVHELLGIQALLVFGNEAQKKKYLPDLASGKKIATLCFYETCSGWDSGSISTTACHMSGDACYTINGTKAWVTNSEVADLFIVFAKEINRGEPNSEEISVFLVDKDSDGLKVSAFNDTTGLLGSNAGVVELQDVIVPEENILGPLRGGSFMIYKLRDLCRFGIGTLTFGVLKSLFDNVTEYVIDAERNMKSLSEFQLVKKRLSKVVQMIYAMESVTYFTAAIHDTTENPDCTLENSIVKVFNTEGTLFCLRELMAMLGCFSLKKQQHLEKFYRDAQALIHFDCPNDLIRLQIGLAGCQFVGIHTAKLIEQSRNPYFFPKIHMKNVYRYYRISKEKFRYDYDIAGYLHPSLVFQGNKLEECLQRMELAVHNVLMQHGSHVVDTQFDPVKLADLAINLYVRAAVLSRSSRSYCIGLKNTHQELRLAAAFCQKAEADFMRIFKDILKGSYANGYDDHLFIGGHVVQNRGFFPEHPLKHNF